MGAMEWAHENGRHSQLLALGYALGPFWFRRGHVQERLAVYPWALEAAKASGDTRAEWWAEHQLAVVFAGTGRLDEARAGFERALALARELHDPAAEAAELRNLGVFLAQQFDEPAEGRRRILDSLAISERLGGVYEMGKCHQFLAWIDEGEGNREATISHYREALRRFEQVQSPDAEDVREALRRLGGEA
jgi:tetratricopeptide (TPR) repeat protein